MSISEIWAVIETKTHSYERQNYFNFQTGVSESLNPFLVSSSSFPSLFKFYTGWYSTISVSFQFSRYLCLNNGISGRWVHFTSYFPPSFYPVGFIRGWFSVRLLFTFFMSQEVFWGHCTHFWSSFCALSYPLGSPWMAELEISIIEDRLHM